MRRALAKQPGKPHSLHVLQQYTHPHLKHLNEYSNATHPTLHLHVERSCRFFGKVLRQTNANHCHCTTVPLHHGLKQIVSIFYFVFSRINSTVSHLAFRLQSFYAYGESIARGEACLSPNVDHVYSACLSLSVCVCT